MMSVSEKMSTFVQKEKKKAVTLEDDANPDIVWNVTKEFIKCIDEADFDRMHKVTDTVYGFVDKPALLPDIVVVIDKLARTNRGKIVSLDALIKSISSYRTKEMGKSGLLGHTIMTRQKSGVG
jgi:hypothetical protein